MKKIIIFSLILPIGIINAVNSNTRLDVMSDERTYIVDKSVKYIEFFIQVTTELASLKNKIYEMLKEMANTLQDVHQSSNNKQYIQSIIKNIEKINNNLLQYAQNSYDLNDNNSNGDDSSDNDGSDNDNSNENTVGQKDNADNDYIKIISGLSNLYGYTIKLTTKFNCLIDDVEKYIEEISHDIRNLNSSDQEKHKVFQKINKQIKVLSKDLNVLGERTKKQLLECDNQLENISNKKKKNNSNKEKDVEDQELEKGIEKGNEKETEEKDEQNSEKGKDKEEKAKEKSIEKEEQKDKQKLKKTKEQKEKAKEKSNQEKIDQK